MKVYLSKDGRFEAPGKQSKGAEKIDVPTDTAGLVDYLNELTSNVPPQDALGPLPPPEVEEEEATDLGTADDGLPEARTAFTAAQIHHMFKPHPAHLRELCYQISKLKAEDLGAVAFEVAHGFARRGAA